MKFMAEPGVKKLVKEAVPLLERVSKERQRDALLDVINVSNVHEAFNYMLEIGLIAQLFPKAEDLQDVELSLPHTYNAWDHTMQVMHYCQQIMVMLDLAPPLAAYHPRLVEALNRLNRHFDHIQKYINECISSDRTKYQLFILSAFFHDLAKGVVDNEFKGDRRKFPGHAKRGADLVRDWSEAYNFSKKECNYLYSIVRMHMKVSRPEMINISTKNVSVYRFFKRAGEAGVLTALLHLADVLTTYEEAMTDDRWDDAVTAADTIFDAYFINYDELVNPLPLVNGNELMQMFGLRPGREIGDLLGALQEEQASGTVHNHQQALSFLKKRIANGQERESSV